MSQANHKLIRMRALAVCFLALFYGSKQSLSFGQATMPAFLDTHAALPNVYLSSIT